MPTRMKHLYSHSFLPTSYKMLAERVLSMCSLSVCLSVCLSVSVSLCQGLSPFLPVPISHFCIPVRLSHVIDRPLFLSAYWSVSATWNRALSCNHALIQIHLCCTGSCTLWFWGRGGQRVNLSGRGAHQRHWWQVGVVFLVMDPMIVSESFCYIFLLCHNFGDHY